MTKLTTAARAFIKNDSGATAIEYGLLAALISVVCLVTWGLIGDSLNAKFVEINAALQ